MKHRRDLIFFSDGFPLGIYCSITSMIMISMVGCIIKVLIACLKSSPVLRYFEHSTGMVLVMCAELNPHFPPWWVWCHCYCWSIVGYSLYPRLPFGIVASIEHFPKTAIYETALPSRANPSILTAKQQDSHRKLMITKGVILDMYLMDRDVICMKLFVKTIP